MILRLLINFNIQANGIPYKLTILHYMYQIFKFMLNGLMMAPKAETSSH